MPERPRAPGRPLPPLTRESHSATDASARLRPISSGQNALVKQLRAAFRSAELTDDGCCAIESVHLVEEAVRSGLRFKALFFSESGRSRADRLLSQISKNVEAVVLADDLFESAVATEHPQGVAALVHLKQRSLENALAGESPVVLVAAGVQDPGNLGTMVRSAEAFGSAAVITTSGTVSPYNSKVIRASAGSLFRLPVVAAKSSELLATLRQRGVRLVATSSHKGTSIDEAQLSGTVAIFVGNEGAGLPRDLSGEMEEFVLIPHSPRVESLNAGIAASIVLYEIARQRREK